MPDWSYRPLFRPLLFRLPPERARDLTLGAIGRLAALPLGPSLIDLLEHMRPADGATVHAMGLELASPIGLAAGLDPRSLAPAALAHFGFGFLELGPVTLLSVASERRAERREREQVLLLPTLPANDGLEALLRRLPPPSSLRVPIGFRLANDPAASPAQAAAERVSLALWLAPRAAFFTLDTRATPADQPWSHTDWRLQLGAIRGALADQRLRPRLLVSLAADLDPERVDAILQSALELGIDGVVVDDRLSAPDGVVLVGPPAHAPALALVRQLRRRGGARLTIVAGGGVHEPADALELLDVGADLVTVSSGLVYSGPGLPKRINEALESARYSDHGPHAARTASVAWVAMALLGLGLAVSGLLALVVAATRVVLPYDETFLGLTRSELALLNPNLLPFLAHDRVTFAGVLLSLGVLNAQLALWGLRRGARWARQAACCSGLAGFASFFLFLGFGYFDPLHAVGTALLLPCFLLGLFAPLPAAIPPPAPLRAGRSWLPGLWGQLVFVVLGLGLIAAGLRIALVGVTTVFVPEDLVFMHTTSTALAAANPRLLPLVAHDRAGFGGALVAEGVAVLLIALWGYRPGGRWLWWTFLASGLSALAATLAVHAAVGYTDLWHLGPSLIALVLYLGGLALSYQGLTALPAPRVRAEPAAELRAALGGH